MLWFCFCLIYIKIFFNQKNWKHSYRLTALPFLFLTFFLYHPWLFIRLIKISGDIEKNPGNMHYLIIFHWNLYSIATPKFIKVALLKAHLCVYEMVIICLSRAPVEGVTGGRILQGIQNFFGPALPESRRRLWTFWNIPHFLFQLAFLKNILILLFQLMMMICKFVGTALLGLIIIQTQNADEFWYITKIFYP